MSDDVDTADHGSEDAPRVLDVSRDGDVVLAQLPLVVALVARAERAGIDLRGTWLVGGAVRDALIGRGDQVHDIDIAVEGDAVAVGRALADALDGTVTQSSEFGTSTVALELGGDDGWARVDLATCRRERYDSPGALPTVELGASITDDLARRDITINTLALSLGPVDERNARVMLDEFDGVADLAARRLRVLHDQSFVDDPTRLFRVARYAGRFAGAVDDHTHELAHAAVQGGALATISADRLRRELEFILSEPAFLALAHLLAWGALHALEPRLEHAINSSLLLRAIDNGCGDDVELNARAWTFRLAALVRPLDGDASAWMRWLEFPAGVIDQVLAHIRLLDAVLQQQDELLDTPNSELYRQLGDLAHESIALAALVVGTSKPALVQRLIDYQQAVDATNLTVRGHDVMAAGVPAGRRVGEILGTIFLRSLDGEIRGEGDERAALAELARDTPDTTESPGGD